MSINFYSFALTVQQAFYQNATFNYYIYIKLDINLNLNLKGALKENEFHTEDHHGGEQNFMLQQKQQTNCCIKK